MDKEVDKCLSNGCLGVVFDLVSRPVAAQIKCADFIREAKTVIEELSNAVVLIHDAALKCEDAACIGSFVRARKKPTRVSMVL